MTVSCYRLSNVTQANALLKLYMHKHRNPLINLAHLLLIFSYHNATAYHANHSSSIFLSFFLFLLLFLISCRHLRQKAKGNKKVTIVCIDHALKLVKQFGLSIGEWEMWHWCVSYKLWVSYAFKFDLSPVLSWAWIAISHGNSNNIENNDRNKT